MTFAIILLGTVIGCFALKTPLKKCPTAFYVLAVMVDVLFIASQTIGLPREIWSVLFVLIQKCTLSLALFIVVMYIGVLPRSSKSYQWLKPIRGELSIVAWILSLGHMAVYLGSYAPMLVGGIDKVNTNVLGSFVFAIILFVLLLLLGITSFDFVKQRMKAESWKKLQKLSYPFFGLVYVHVLLMLLPSAMHGGIASSITVGVYSVVFGAYAIFRIYRAVKDKQACTK